MPTGARRRYFAEETAEFQPHMMTELEDELARSRMREAFWISVVVHIMLAVALFTSPKWMPNWAQPHLVSVDDLMRGKQPTFLALPSDLQKLPKKVQSDKISDKDRQAQTRQPQIDRKTLDSMRGDQHAEGPRAQAPPQPMPPQAAPQGGGQQGYQQPQRNETQSAMNIPQQRPQPEQPRGNPFRMPGSAGDQIASASRNVPRMGGGGGIGYGVGDANRREKMGGLEILSDTQGVNFGPYIARMVMVVQRNFDALEPEAAMPPMMKKGRVIIRYVILPDGKITGMVIEASSGDVSLDRAAWGSLTASSPLGPLPKEFHGPYLAIRAGFFYNYKTGEMEREF